MTEEVPVDAEIVQRKKLVVM